MKVAAGFTRGDQHWQVQAGTVLAASALPSRTALSAPHQPTATR